MAGSSRHRGIKLQTRAVIAVFLVFMCCVSSINAQTEANDEDVKSHDPPESHDHAGESHDHAGESHDHTDESHDHDGESHDHADESHDHADESHDHAGESHDHADESHDHADESHDHAHESHDHVHEPHNHTNESHHHGEESSSTNNTVRELTETEIFIKELFSKYGHAGVMTFEGFEHLLENIGLAEIRIRDHNIQDHHTDIGFKVSKK